jgi:hypothetical protein
MLVVAQYDTSAPHLGTATETYEYSFGEVDLLGRGFRGFKIITRKNLATGTEDTTNFAVVGDGTTRGTRQWIALHREKILHMGLGAFVPQDHCSKVEYEPSDGRIRRGYRRNDDDGSWVRRRSALNHHCLCGWNP